MLCTLCLRHGLPWIQQHWFDCGGNCLQI
jgi:hypothetical protein